jgi:hypothetical protein
MAQLSARYEAVLFDDVPTFNPRSIKGSPRRLWYALCASPLAAGLWAM